MSELAVVGGYYRELCFEPAWDTWYGPGFRAAAALCDRGHEITLHTFCPKSELPSFRFRCGSFGIVGQPVETECSIKFTYLHWLKEPTIETNGVVPQEPVTTAADLALVFGFYEGISSVDARRCVFDPQRRGIHLAPPKARDLAISCNFGEAIEWSGLAADSSPEVVAQTVGRRFNATTVAVKGAWSGLCIWTQEHSEVIPPLPTARVHKIGSGDVFSAEFAHALLLEQAEPLEAARAAVARTAYYCDNASLPNPLGFTPSPAPLQEPAIGDYDVYIAAPFFDVGQMFLVEEFRRIFLDAGLKVFSPYHNVGWGDPARVAQDDLRGLENSRCVLACAATGDIGTIFEVGHARAQKRPVIAYAPKLGPNDETMLIGSNCELVRDFTSAAYRVIWTCQQ